jgi:hypothetical protein
MAIGGTTVGPLEPETRDRVRAYKNKAGHDNYNDALRALLDEAGADSAEDNA